MSSDTSAPTRAYVEDGPCGAAYRPHRCRVDRSHGVLMHDMRRSSYTHDVIFVRYTRCA